MGFSQYSAHGCASVPTGTNALLSLECLVYCSSQTTCASEGENETKVNPLCTGYELVSPIH